jgi:molybdopterin-guanine dinucleotide biosynthesis protein A
MPDIKTHIISPALHAIILTGGRSRRMGHDKAQIIYHNKPHYQYTADMVNPYVEQTYISVAHDNDTMEEAPYPHIKDSYQDIGPIGGILSALEYNTDVAWLTVACDLPYITADVIRQIIRHRQKSKMATCYINPESKLPEPLLTVWEPKSYSIIKKYLGKSILSPKRILMDNDIELVKIKNTKALMNANDPMQKNKAMKDLGHS